MAARAAAARRDRDGPQARAPGVSDPGGTRSAASSGRSTEGDGFLEFRRSRGPAPTLLAVGLGLVSAVAILVWFQIGR